MQKRKFSRVQFQSEALVKSESREVRAEVANLSLKGMFLKTEEKFPVNEAVDMKIFLSGTSSELTINVNGTVVRNEDSGLGIVFNRMDLDSFIYLRNVISYNIDDDATVMEEFFRYMRPDEF